MFEKHFCNVIDNILNLPRRLKNAYRNWPFDVKIHHEATVVL